jgi:hypothetical protein
MGFIGINWSLILREGVRQQGAEKNILIEDG